MAWADLDPVSQPWYVELMRLCIMLHFEDIQIKYEFIIMYFFCNLHLINRGHLAIPLLFHQPHPSTREQCEVIIM